MTDNKEVKLTEAIKTLIDEGKVAEFQKWWDINSPEDVPLNKRAWMYSYMKGNKQLPLNFVIRSFGESEGISFQQQYGSPGMPYHIQFANKFGLKIIEEPKYDQTMLSKMQDCLRGFKNTDVLEKWFAYIQSEIEKIGIEAFHCRFAIRSGNGICVQLVDRIVWEIAETKGGETFLKFLLTAEEAKRTDYSDTQSKTYKDDSSLMLAAYKTTTWGELSQEVLEKNHEAVQSLYDQNRHSELLNAQRGAGNTNNAMKYMVYNKLSIADMDNFQNAPEELDNAPDEPTSDNNSNTTPILNTILYGPPGTGKTYNTINYALSIIEKKAIASIQNEDRTAVLKRYKKYESQGQIVFTTFHQSMTYEDFIEGIKPVLKEDENQLDAESQLAYEIRDGILKNLQQKISDDEKLLKSQEQDLYIPEKHFKLPINKISLGNSQLAEDKAIYEYCIENNCIANGFGEDIDFTAVKNKKEIRERLKKGGIESTSANDFNVSAMERLIFWMETDQLVFVSNGNSTLRSIGVITGDYYFDENTSIRYSQFRPVKWLHKEVDIPIKEIYSKSFSQQSIYQMDQDQVKRDIFSKQAHIDEPQSNYVLIIDEINRGNISSIFGELITLIETDKRKGEKEEISVILPYSQTKFSIPNNLFILGTMNTADRSVEALDTALRRRFSFIEMPPICSLPELDKEVAGMHLAKLLETINHRIEKLLDKDHLIGHAYFIGVENEEDLARAFNDKIVPLLQEYFYNDFAKIGMVLGKGFVKKKSEAHRFADFDDAVDGDYENRDVFEIKHVASGDLKEAIAFLVNKKEKKNENS